MEPASTIRDAVAAVSRLRAAMQGEALLGQAVLDIKKLQSRRFSGLYADLLQSSGYAAGASFFLEELYGDKDYARRDEQFARIAGAIERFFPPQVAHTAAALARLHALTEDLDVQMARVWLALPADGGDVRRYAVAWRNLGQREERAHQLESVMTLGTELARLTRTPGLRTMLRLMRGPATAGGLGDLQRFLENGFDTFAGMSRRSGAAEYFLATVDERERGLMQVLYGDDLVASETELQRILGQAP